MNPNLKRLVAAMASAGLCTLAACGGGGGSSTEQAPAAGAPVAETPVQTPAETPSTPAVTAPKSVTFSGIAATGAALSGATVQVYDSTGAVVCTTTTGSGGDYSCDLGTTPKPPFVVTATLDDTRLVSMFAEATSSTVNVTPVTNLVAARLSSTGDPVKLIDDIAATPGTLDKAKLETAVTDVMTILKPVLDALGEKTNPLTGTFSADGTGHDKLLDALQITVRPEGATSNIEITVKTKPTAEDAEPVKVSFAANSTAPAPIVASVSAADLGTDNVAVQISDMLKRMGNCYALPVADRVTNGLNAGSTIKAPECKGLFPSDDPTQYLSNGARVGPTGAFAGIFKAGAQGLAFDRGNFEFYRANGDVVFSYRWTATDGSTDNEQVVARKDSSGALRLVGNQYLYQASVRAYMQNRELINTPLFNHVDVGYNLSVANATTNGNALFSKVLVTTPKGNVLTLRPTAGLGYLVLVNSQGQNTATSVLRLNGKYVDPTTAGHPREKETSLFYADPTAYPDSVIKTIPDQGVWKLEFFHADTNVPNVIQTYRTTSRAPTLAEAMMTSVAELTPAMKTELISETASSGVVTFGVSSVNDPNVVDLSASGGADAWRVPSGALAPTSVNVYGRAPTVANVAGARFNDGLGVGTNARKVLIRCQTQGGGDLHCDPSTPTLYAQGTTINSIELWARSPRQVEVSKMIGTYKLQ